MHCSHQIEPRLVPLTTTAPSFSRGRHHLVWIRSEDKIKFYCDGDLVGTEPFEKYTGMAPEKALIGGYRMEPDPSVCEPSAPHGHGKQCVPFEPHTCTHP